MLRPRVLFHETMVLYCACFLGFARQSFRVQVSLVYNALRVYQIEFGRPSEETSHQFKVHFCCVTCIRKSFVSTFRCSTECIFSPCPDFSFSDASLSFYMCNNVSIPRAIFIVYNFLMYKQCFLLNKVLHLC